MTLPIKLDLDMVQADPHVKLFVHMSNGSAMRVLTDRHTDTQTGPILLPRPLTQEVKMDSPWMPAEHISQARNAKAIPQCMEIIVTCKMPENSQVRHDADETSVEQESYQTDIR